MGEKIPLPIGSKFYTGDVAIPRPDPATSLMQKPFFWRIDADRFVFGDKEEKRIKLVDFINTTIKKLNYYEKMKWLDVSQHANTHPVNDSQTVKHYTQLKNNKISDTELWQLYITKGHRVFGCVDANGVFCLMLNDPYHKQTKTH